jgi:hypothetical protein
MASQWCAGSWFVTNGRGVTGISGYAGGSGVRLGLFPVPTVLTSYRELPNALYPPLLPILYIYT